MRLLCLALRYSFLCSVLMLSGVVSICAIPSSSARQSPEQSRVPSLGPGFVVPRPQTVLWTPPTPDTAPRDFVTLYARVDVPQTPPYRVSSTTPLIFRNMPPLLPREITRTASVSKAHDFGLPHLSTGSASPLKFIEATYRFTRVTACRFAGWELTTPCCQSAAPSAIGVYGQFPERDFNPLDKQLLLHTDTILNSGGGIGG